MREVKIFVTVQYEEGSYVRGVEEDEVIAAKCGDLAQALGGEVIDLEIK
ncbi:hypothetical protein [Burkholderia pseudomallei]|uniref:Uncharacterized protein n=1 Tax=Burkholderia pseudomallei 1710a TaxID=320371 RepID=A0A0E1W2R4_BURPE|nr:hypothetical protein [Burkholderia pseudomallei]AIS47980.1 hypothetical protein DR61_1315 [Burkholderia pseudomallei]EET06719.1 hypothetical protein BURPS1710A_1859 [Burkholderia pseudomallei 1710a]KGD19852.1 hypothetical protein DR60_4380 [Burkholderia pseudomallei]CAJ2828786.1 Uncharacterised protein [Burkholderia pseudomallei]CAJ3469296.1 Uncharacterised protein [Burkholderia pseudomallei]